MRFLVALGFVAGCGFSPSAKSDGQTQCQSGCQGSALVDCDTGMSTTCALGCTSDRCASLVPSNGATTGDTGTGDLAIVHDSTLDTSNGAITEDGTGTVIRAAGEGESANGLNLRLAGTDRAIVGAKDFTIANGATLHVVGPRALIVVASHDIDIQGVLDASAGLSSCALTNVGQCGGPAGGNGGSPSSDGSGCAPGASGSHNSGDETGGGGGGFGGAGANGGNGNNPGGAGGTGTCSSAAIVPIIGGSGGGGGSSGGVGGGGGGALQLTALDSIIIHNPPSGVRAQIRANGAGGTGGVFSVGGGGAGSGGAILLEAPTVSLDGATIVANGGGGGAGNGGSSGNPGALDTSQAIGGTGGRAGGLGGAKAGDATPGFGGGDGTGGGGGGVGRIYISAATYNSPDALISPTEGRGMPTTM